MSNDTVGTYDSRCTYCGTVRDEPCSEHCSRADAERDCASARSTALAQQPASAPSIAAALRQIVDADDQQELTQQHIEIGRAALEALAAQCRCTYAQRLQGDGCDACNPSRYSDEQSEASRTVPSNTLPMPQNAAQAELMAKVGVAWLQQHAPERLTAQAVPAKPLTDKQITDLVREASRGGAIRRDGSTSLRIARAIERAHGIGAEQA